MDDLIAFLRARLDEDETVARGAGGGWITLGPDPERTNSVGRHSARWDPARVLAEVDAKRKLIELYLMTYETSTLDSDAWTVMKDAMRTLTQPYANHPDYRPEWRS